jgi:hypothetical protein
MLLCCKREANVNVTTTQISFQSLKKMFKTSLLENIVAASVRKLDQRIRKKLLWNALELRIIIRTRVKLS